MANVTSMSNTGFKKPFAVVTGASSGIGRELAKEFARNGYDLLVIAEDTGLETAAQEFRALGAEVQTAQQDLATHDGVHAAYQAIKGSGRPVDAIALNAGVGLGGAFLDTDLEKEMNIINLNIVSVVHLAKHVLRDMKVRNEGRVLFTASVASEMPGSFQSVYNASKAFVLSFAQAVRNELKDTNITITALQPGATDTNFFARAEMLDTKVAQDKKDDPAEVAKMGYDALMAGKDHVVAASFKTKVMNFASEILPDTTVAEMHRKMAEPGSGKKAS